MPVVAVRILFFASAREAADGLSELSVQIGEESSDTIVDTSILR